MALKFDELKGTKLKKVVNAKRVGKHYHNKNKSGGNFGITIRMKNDDVYQLNGYYNTDGVVYLMSFGEGYGLGKRIVRPDNYLDFTFADLSRIMKEKIGVELQPVRREVSDRDRGAIVKDINGIKFVNFAHDSRLSDTSEIVKTAEKIVRDRSERLKEKGFRRVEFDTIGGYYHRRVNKGRFIPITTMHNLRLMKR